MVALVVAIGLFYILIFITINKVMKKETEKKLEMAGFGLLGLGLLALIIYTIVMLTKKDDGCTSRCSGKACGADDGCGSPCQTGSCPEGQTCQSGTCQGGGGSCTAAGQDLFASGTCLSCCDGLKPYLIWEKDPSKYTDPCSYFCYDPADPNLPPYTGVPTMGTRCKEGPEDDPCGSGPPPGECAKAGENRYATGSCQPCCDGLQTYQVWDKSPDQPDPCALMCYNSSDPNLPPYDGSTKIGNRCLKDPFSYDCPSGGLHALNYSSSNHTIKYNYPAYQSDYSYGGCGTNCCS